MTKWGLSQESKAINAIHQGNSVGWKETFQQMELYQLDICMEKNTTTLILNLILRSKIKSKWHVNLNIRTKILEENTQESICIIGFGKDF